MSCLGFKAFSWKLQKLKETLKAVKFYIPHNSLPSNVTAEASATYAEDIARVPQDFGKAEAVLLEGQAGPFVHRWNRKLC